MPDLVQAGIFDFPLRQELLPLLSAQSLEPMPLIAAFDTTGPKLMCSHCVQRCRLLVSGLLESVVGAA